MKPIYVYGDPANPKNFSSGNIIYELNKAAKQEGIYDEKGIKVCYSSTNDNHGVDNDVFINTYELDFPQILIDRAKGKPILGVSRDNLKFIKAGGYEKCDWFMLGVDSEKWRVAHKKWDLDKFCVGVYSESLVRGGIELAIEAFVKAFGDRKDCVLKIKDRNATPVFKANVQRMKDAGINIEYTNAHWKPEQVIEFFEGVDCHLYLNRSSTFALPPLEAMSMGVPTIIVPYSGPREYCFEHNALLCDFELVPIESEIYSLITIGCRNFFFMDGYKTEPVWARAICADVASNLLKLSRDDGYLMSRLSNEARITAEGMNWRRSALELQLKANQFV